MSNSNLNQGCSGHPWPAESARPFSLVYCAVVQAQPGERYQRPNLEVCILEKVTAGRGRLEIACRKYEVSSGDMYILPPGYAHVYEADRDEPWSKEYFVCRGPLVEALLAAYGIREFYLPAFSDEGAFRRLDALYQARDEEMHDRAACEFHRLLTLVRQAHTGGRQRYSPPVAQAMRFIERHLEDKIGMPEIAREVCLTPTHLGRLFKRELGVSPYDWLLKRRVELAKDWLECSNQSLARIAERLQYADQYYFSNSFKRATGQSPAHYRRAFVASVADQPKTN